MPSVRDSCRCSSCAPGAYSARSTPDVRSAWCTWDASSASSRHPGSSAPSGDPGTKSIRKSKREDYLKVIVSFSYNFTSENSSAAVQQDRDRKAGRKSKTNRKCSGNSPIISTTRNVSITGSIISSGMRTNLLFCKCNCSSEFKFSKAMAGRTLML